MANRGLNNANNANLSTVQDFEAEHSSFTVSVSLAILLFDISAVVAAPEAASDDSDVVESTPKYFAELT